MTDPAFSGSGISARLSGVRGSSPPLEEFELIVSFIESIVDPGMESIIEPSGMEGIVEPSSW